MAAVLPSTVRLRHVVFASTTDARKRAVDFSPMPAPTRPSQRPSGFDEDDERFLRWLFGTAGLELGAYRMETLQRRLPACLRAVRASDTRECRDRLRHDRDLLSLAVSTLVIGVTSFFRDTVVFDRLRDQILPEMTQRGETLRVWSAGCSDGAELYSLAMLLADRRVLHACKLVGSDCRRDAIERARGGLYPAPSLKGLATDYLDRFLVPEAGGWRVRADIRAALQWRVENVLKTAAEPPAGTWDMILCRNMMMYLQPETAGRLFKLFERTLRPGGILVLGKAERPIGAAGLAPIGTCMYQRTDT